MTRANSQLALDLNVSEKTVRRAITALKKAGLLKVIRQGGLHVGPSTYRLKARDMRSIKAVASEAMAAEPEPEADEAPELCATEAA